MENQVKAQAKYLAQQAARKTFYFGPVWNNAVLAGKVTDENKVIAHAVKLKLGKKSDLKRTKFATVLAKLQRHLASFALSN